ncbi:Vascular non-inflammatory molecule 3, partial [Fragariocoptes setiger]
QSFLESTPKDHEHQEVLTAAVFEHSRIGEDNPNPKADLESNLRVFEQVAYVASKKGVVILVYPEAALYKLKTRAEAIQVFDLLPPDPQGPNAHLMHKQLRPCDYPDHAVHRPILQRLSCLAKRVQMYLVVNLGTYETCLSGDSFLGSNLPFNYQGITSGKGNNETISTLFEQLDEQEICRDRRRNYNTLVAIDSSGAIVSRYRKRHLFNEEPIYDAPTKADRSYFDTPFGRFGLIVCFDLVYADPAIQLVLLDKVDTVILSSRWYDELPLFSAISSQAAWSHAMDVNLLAANSHNNPLGTVGSGLYSGKSGPVIYAGVDMHQKNLSENSARSWLSRTYEYIFGKKDTNRNLESRLIVGVIPKSTRHLKSESKTFMKDNMNSVVNVVTQVAKGAQSSRSSDEYNYMNMLPAEGDTETNLSEYESIIDSCNNGFCCRIDYKIKVGDGDQRKRVDKYLASGKLVLLLRNGLRPGRYPWYEQFCAFAVVQNNKSKDGKRRYAIKDGIEFDRLSLAGNFSTPFVMVPASSTVSRLVPVEYLNLKCNTDIKEIKITDNHEFVRDTDTNFSNECSLTIDNYRDNIIIFQGSNSGQHSTAKNVTPQHLIRHIQHSTTDHKLITYHIIQYNYLRASEKRVGEMNNKNILSLIYKEARYRIATLKNEVAVFVIANFPFGIVRDGYILWQFIGFGKIDEPNVGRFMIVNK